MSVSIIRSFSVAILAQALRMMLGGLESMASASNADNASTVSAGPSAWAVASAAASESYLGSSGKGACASSSAINTQLVAAGSASTPTSSASAQFTCSKCKKVMPRSQMSTRPGVCKVDGAAYKSLCDRWTKNRKLKSWWVGLNEEEQRLWFVKQQTNPAGTKRRFADVEYQEKTSTSVGALEDEVDLFMTWARFKREGSQGGKQVEDLELEWADLVSDPSVEAIMRRGQWLVPEFQGVERRKRKATTQEHSASRGREVDDENQLAILRQSGEDLLNKFSASVAAPLRPLPADVPSVPDVTPADQPMSSAPTDFILHTINREVTAQAKEKAWRDQMAADDLLAAATAAARVKDGGAVADKSTKYQTNLEKVRLQGKCMELKARIEEQLATAKTTHDDGRKKLETCLGKNIDLDNMLKESLASYLQAHDKARTYLEGLTHMADSINDATKPADADLDDVRSRMISVSKDMLKNDLRDFNAQTNKVIKTVHSVERSLKMQTGKDHEVNEAAAPQPPLIHILTTMSETLCTPPGSIFEAKGGLKACLLGPKSGQDPACEIHKLSYIKKGQKELTEHMKSNHWGVWQLKEEPKAKKVNKMLDTGFDQNVRAKMLLPALDWAKMVFETVMWMTGVGHVHVGMGHFCCMEARLLLEGKEIVLGIPLEKIPGSNMKEKRKHLFSATIDTLTTLLGQGGFLHEHDSSKLLVLPTGFMFVFVSTGACGLRWAVSSDDADTERVKAHLSALIHAFPEMKNPSTGHGQLLDWLVS